MHRNKLPPIMSSSPASTSEKNMVDPTLYNTQTILDLLRLREDGHDRFVGDSHFMGSPNVFGGQVLGIGRDQPVDGRPL